MKIKITVSLLLIISTFAFSQKTDTLTFYSQAFDEMRTVYVHTPAFYKYQSDSVKLPVIYILDGQNEWFVNPVLNQIKYLQYTHEIPNAIVVVIPHKNRNKECGVKDINNKQPLDKFITQEIDLKIKPYKPGAFKVIIGHSFSASFALFSFINNPTYYSAVIANTPLDNFEALVVKAYNNDQVNKTGIFISVGAVDKDGVHRKEYNRLRSNFNAFFNSINTFEADYATHTAVPVVATPSLLSKLFNQFSRRYFQIAAVNEFYQLIDKPSSIDDELAGIRSASKIGSSFYPPEIPDINGIASRFKNNGYPDYALKVYELGSEYHPGFYGFYLSQYNILLKKDIQKSKYCLEKARLLLLTLEEDSSETKEILKEIGDEMKKNGW